MPDLVGHSLGKYQLVDRLGRGGMADVYRAYQPGLDRYVAVKVLHPHLADQPNFVSRFKREAQSVSALHHPNIVQVFDFDIQGENYYMVMDYIEDGRTLKEVLEELARDGHRLPVEQVLDLTAKVADALAYAHQQGMIHRDVKPANILIQSLDSPILSDFGIAHIIDAATLTRSGAAVGTPAYMAPEQGNGGVVTERSDIYALGVTLYEMLTGKRPYEADTPYAVILKHISDPIVPPHTIVPLPSVVEPIVLKAMAKKPEYRFSSADEMATTLRDALVAIRNGHATQLSQPDTRITAFDEITPVSSRTPALTEEVATHELDNDVLGGPGRYPQTATGIAKAGAPEIARARASGAGRAPARTVLIVVGLLALAALLVWYFVFGGGHTTIPAAPPGMIFAANIEGVVELTVTGQPVRQLKTGDTVAVGAGSPGTILRIPGAGKAIISLDDGSVLYIGSGTTIGLDSLIDPSRQSTGTLLTIQIGMVMAKVAPLQGNTFVVETPVGTRADVFGTVIGLQYFPDLEQFNVDCLEGHCRQFGGPGIPPLTLGACQRSIVVSVGAPEGPGQADSGPWRSLFGDAAPDCSTSTPASTSAGPFAPILTRVPLVPTFTPALSSPVEVTGTHAAATSQAPTNTPVNPIATIASPINTLVAVPNTLIPATSIIPLPTDIPTLPVEVPLPTNNPLPPVNPIPTVKPPVKVPPLPQLP